MRRLTGALNADRLVLWICRGGSIRCWGGYGTRLVLSLLQHHFGSKLNLTPSMNDARSCLAKNQLVMCRPRLASVSSPSGSSLSLYRLISTRGAQLNDRGRDNAVTHSTISTASQAPPAAVAMTKAIRMRSCRALLKIVATRYITAQLPLLGYSQSTPAVWQVCAQLNARPNHMSVFR